MSFSDFAQGRTCADCKRPFMFLVIACIVELKTLCSPAPRAMLRRPTVDILQAKRFRSASAILHRGDGMPRTSSRMIPRLHAFQSGIYSYLKQSILYRETLFFPSAAACSFLPFADLGCRSVRIVSASPQVSTTFYRPVFFDNFK